MCAYHWRKVPRATQSAIWAEYRNGQEVAKDPTVRYLAVQCLAVAQVAFKANDEAAARVAAGYLAEAARHRQLSIDAGDGDPLAGLVPA
jgi:hypothetical protein